MKENKIIILFSLLVVFYIIAYLTFLQPFTEDLKELNRELNFMNSKIDQYF